MKQLRIYNNYPQGVESHKDLLDYIVSKTKGLKFVLHNTVDNRVGYVDIDTTPQPIDYSKVAMFFENVGTDDAVISVKKSSTSANTTSLEISTDNKNWETWGSTSTTALSKTIGAGERLYIRNANDVGYFNKSASDYNKFSSTGANIIIGGNIMSLGYKNFENEYTIKQSYAYRYLFKDMTTLVDASRLVLPATTLANNCYTSMFDGCTSLRTAPELPATTLANGCYQYMFRGCTSLTTAPSILPATTLANNCYYYMFNGCTSLTKAPELPATQLANYCYDSMFYKCTSLKTAPELPATQLANYCYYYMFYGCTSLTTAPAKLPATTLATCCYQYMFYGCTSLTTAPELPATTLANNCYYYMFNGCTSLTKAPELPATQLANNCYEGMFRDCKPLTTAPELPATTLANNCYEQMFQNCTSLNYIKAMFIDADTDTYIPSLLDNVAPNGTFVKNAQATWYESDIVPNGWTVETATE